jgi:serine/threonine-protein kinase
VKVTDFGIARITDSSKTKTGLVLGTPSFMSPEQIAGKKVDGRSDLYSLGVMLFQLVTGMLPFRGDSMAELMFKIANEDAPDLLRLRPEFPERLGQVVALALAKKPELRYQDGGQLAADLRELLAELSEHEAGALNDPGKPAVLSLASAARAQAALEKTLVMAANGALPAPEPASAGSAPGYDAARPQADGAFAKTTVFNKPDSPRADPEA